MLPPRRLLLTCALLAAPAASGLTAQTVQDVPGAGVADTSNAARAGVDETERLDARAFRYIYAQDSPAFAGTMRQVNSASVPLFVAAIPVSATTALASGSDLDPTVSLAASIVGSVGLVYAVKSTVRRDRPYRALEGIEARVHVPEVDPDPFSLPSGHAAVSFAIATSTTLSYPRWYVATPAYAWATATALARVWHGVHFPSDVILGAAIGAGTAALVQVLLPEVDPGDSSDAATPPPSLTLLIRL
jgi:membrane-associated phospholipid phosphatase